MKEEYFVYRIKCRSCSDIKLKYYSPARDEKAGAFMTFINNHKNKSIVDDCRCDKESKVIHDLISYNTNYKSNF
jgi:hypothetical protein